MKLRSILTAAVLVLAAGMAQAASVPLFSGPQGPPTLLGPLNTLINLINGILSPLTGGGGVNGPTGAAAAQTITLTPGAAGFPAVIGLGAGGDSNGSIQIVPDATGGIILFGQGATGNLVIANQVSWVPAQGLTPCPGVDPKTGVLGLYGGSSGLIAGYWLIKDWLDRPHFTPACG